MTVDPTSHLIVRSQLLDEVDRCELCVTGEQYGFERRPEGRGFYKFPPTIGAAGEASVLFIGINPRISATNRRLHRELAVHESSFQILAGNRVPYNGKAGGPRYISVRCDERHYRPHAKVIAHAFGEHAAFEDHGAVTELFLCASLDSKLLPRDWPCAGRYLSRVITQVKPELVVPVGRTVRDFLSPWTVPREDGRWQVEIAEHRAWAEPMTHSRNGVPPAVISRVGAQLKRIIRGEIPKPLAPDAVQRDGVSGRQGARQKHPDIEHGPSRAALPGAGVANCGYWWRRVLDQNVPATRQMRVLAPLLAAHPDADDLTRVLLEDLTVWKLIRIANVEFNQLRPQHLSPEGDVIARSRAAWERLFARVGAVKMREAGTDWARTEALLLPRSGPALAQLQKMSIMELITACENLIRYPYRSV